MVRVLLGRVWWIIGYGSPLWTRAGLAFASACWAIGLALPGNSMDRPAFVYLRQIGNWGGELVGGLPAEYFWLILFAVHSAGMTWQTLFETTARRVTFAINILGVIVFSAPPMCFVFAAPFPWPSGVASDVACAAAAILVAVRTHIVRESDWRRG